MAKTTKFTRPEKLAELDDDALAQSIEDAMAHGQELASKEDADLTKEEIAELDDIGNFLDEAEVLRDTRATEAKDKSDNLARLRSRVAKKPEGKDGDDDGDEGDDGDDGGDGDEGDEGLEGDKPRGDEIPLDSPEGREPATQSASLRKGTASRAARKGPADSKSKMSLVKKSGKAYAAGEFGGFTNGQEMTTMHEIAKAVSARLANMPRGFVKDTQLRQGAVAFNLAPNKYSQENRDFRNDSDLFYEASREARLEGGSLTAAGGWGAPSETSLDFCELESIDGLYTGPEVTITRGGVQYTRGPSFADVFNASTGFWDMTEAVAEAGVVQKTSLRPEVPDFVEKRLDAVGVMMEAGLLLRAGWPELVERYARLALTAHKVKLAMKSVALIEAYTGAATNLTNGFGNAMDLLHALELVALGERQRNNMADNQTLEALVPSWVKAVLRADLAQRKGVNSLSVTDAEITGLFTARQIRPQFLRAYQNIPLDATTGLALTYPDTVEVIMYPAGTYVRGVSDVIQLDTIYDSVNLKKNDYVHLFVEQGVLMTNPCGEGRRIRLPFIATGSRAADVAKNTGLFNA